MKIVVIGTDLPGRQFCSSEGAPLDDVRVALQVRSEPVGLVRADAPSARWELEAKVEVQDGELDFRGPAVHGKRGERFLYLTWGNVSSDGRFDMFRRAKLMLNRVDPSLVHTALADDHHLVATVKLTDERGHPRCARVDPPAISWQLGGGVRSAQETSRPAR